jgi:serine/threonine protein kinase
MGRAADTKLLGREIAGKYAVESFIGGGAMGSVYRARQRDIDKAVAVKVLHRELLAEPQFAARFKREAKAASRLDHPNSMRVLDFGEEPDGLCYIVMELVDGRNLFHIIKEEAPLAKERVVNFLRQTLAALAVAHDMGVVHRDLKPENIIVLSSTDDDGNVTEVVKVCDFGMAKISASRLEDEEKLSEKLTSHGVVVGTPEYMSPEQGKGETLDGRSDLYSVGVILYQLLTGRLPFTAETAVGVLLKHLIEEPVPPSQIQPLADPMLEAVALRAMKKKREERFASAREMRSALAGTWSERSLPVPPASNPRAAGSAKRVRTPTTQEHALGEAPTVEVQVPPPTMTGLATHGSSPRSLRLARDILSDPPPPPRRSLVPFLLGVVVVGAVGFAAVSGRVPGIPGIPAFAALLSPEEPAASVLPSASAPTVAPGSALPAASAASDAAVVQPETTEAGAALAPIIAEDAATLLATPHTPSANDHPPRPPGRGPELPAGHPLAGPSLPVVAPPAGGPSATPTGFERAHVAMGVVAANRANGADVRDALPTERFNGCYRDVLRATGRSTRGWGTLHVDIADGTIAKASFEGMESLREIGDCIVHAAVGSRVQNVPGAADAEIPLSFKVE